MTDGDAPVAQDVFFRFAEEDSGPWEIGRPQSVVINLVEKGIFNSEMFDIGCATGENSIYISKHAKNVNVTATDLVPKFIEKAREKAKTNQANVRFEVVNILDDISKTNLVKQHSFDIILDTAVFHVFSNEDRLLYIKNLEYLIKPGGLYIQLCFSEKETYDKGPRRIKKADLNELFSSKNGWTIESIEDSVYEFRPNAPMGEKVKAYLSFIRRK